MSTLKSLLDEKIQNKSLLSHSFYQRWMAGTLSREELQGYAKEYYSFEKEFPRFLSFIHSQIEDVETRRHVLKNLVHEEMGEDNHPELWLRFAEGLGVTRDEVKNHMHNDETEHLLRTFRRHVRGGDLISGFASLYAYESQQPGVAESKIEGLRTKYSWADDDSLAFFKAHQYYDVEHSSTEMKLLTDYCETETDRLRAAQVTEEICTALHEFLSGIEKRYQPKPQMVSVGSLDESAWPAEYQ